MPFYFDSKEEGRIEIPIEKWGWAVVYKDETFLQQFDNQNQRFHQIGEVDQSKLALVMMVPHDMQALSSLIIPWEDGMKLVHKYRNIVLDAFGEPRKFRIYIIGWKRGSESFFHYILPDNRIISSTDENLPLSQYL